MNVHRNFKNLRRTARELAKDSGPGLPYGERLWEPTSLVRFPSPVVSASGRFRREVVYCTRGKTCYAREYVTPADPKTFRQLDERDGMKGIQGDWKNLTAAERDGWTAYANLHFTPAKGFYLASPGQNVYLMAQTPRTAWGGGLSHVPPTLPPPPAPLTLVEESAPAAGQVAFRVEHGLEDWAGYRFEFRMCPATINGRKPQETHFCRAGQTAAGSFFPLGASGTFYLMSTPRFDVAPGERFGLGVRLLTPDGVPGPELRVDLTRMDWDDGAGWEPMRAATGQENEDAALNGADIDACEAPLETTPWDRSEQENLEKESALPERTVPRPKRRQAARTLNSPVPSKRLRFGGREQIRGAETCRRLGFPQPPGAQPPSNHPDFTGRTVSDS